MTACLRIAAIADAAGIAVIPHAGMNTPYGQHFGFAVPCSSMGEFFLGTAPGIPLVDTRLFPGMAVPRDGKLVPSDAPGFGIQIAGHKRFAQVASTACKGQVGPP